MKVLYLARWFPYPADNGIKIRISNIISLLINNGFEVDFFCFTNDVPGENCLVLANEQLTNFWLHPFKDYQPRKVKALAGYLSSWPRNLFYSFDKGVNNKINEIINQNKYDFVIHSELDTMMYGHKSVFPTTHILEDLEIASYFDYPEEISYGKKLQLDFRKTKLCTFLMRELKQFELCTVVSKAEFDLVKNFISNQIVVIPNKVSIGNDHNLPEIDNKNLNQLIYPGAITFQANYLAVEYFIQRIFPIVQKSLPDIEFWITGAYDQQNTSKLKANGVKFSGFVEDIEQTISEAMITVVPITKGSGTRIKILESIKAGTPVVSTHKGAEGLDDLVDGEDLLLGDTPEDFASKIVDIISDQKKYNQIRNSGYEKVTKLYNWLETESELIKWLYKNKP